MNNTGLRTYFEAAALANFRLGRFVGLVKTVKGRYLFLHFILVSAMLQMPVMHAVARLEPYELYSRVYGEQFQELLPDSLPEALDAEKQDYTFIEAFNQALYRQGYGRAVVLPLLCMAFGLLLILQIVFYLCAAFCLGLQRITSSRLSFWNRMGVFIMASTLPAIGAALFGLWMPTVHILVFYFSVILLTFTISCKDDKRIGEEPVDFTDSAYTYTGNDLGAAYTPDKTIFKVWSPAADAIEIVLYAQGQVKKDDVPLQRVSMRKGAQGVWQGEIKGDIKNKYYVYAVTQGEQTRQAVDPYTKALGVNGFRGMIVDLRDTDPEGFRKKERSREAYHFPEDAVIYEVHVRDLSMHPNAGIVHKGKFLGFTETGTKNAQGFSTGLDHIKELGVTHVHLLPCFDFKTIDETSGNAVLDGPNQFNWGYDPQNYNAPEGSYATDPFDGTVRIREFKQLIQALHAQGLRVVMDVVYNHTYTAINSNFDILVPSYYHRTNAQGKFTDGSGCGNETASERAMMRKFMVDSVVYWAKEYQIDGFRFDLMALHDIDTMNIIRAELDAIDPGIIIYGEGWTAAPSPLPDSQKALKANAFLLNERIAVFSDDIRDGIKGSVFKTGATGFVNSNTGERREDVKFGIVGGVQHPDIDITKVQYSSTFWAVSPKQSINYVSAHDNLTLWDKLTGSVPGADQQTLLSMNKLAAVIVLTSQGIPFFQAGEEMGRTKKGNDNSYKSPDSINMLDWDRKSEYIDLIAYYQGLIQLRKAYPVFRLGSAAAVQERLHFLPTEPSVIGYILQNHNPPEKGAFQVYRSFALLFNGAAEEKQVRLPSGEWDILVNHNTAGVKALERLTGDTVKVPQKSALVLGML